MYWLPPVIAAAVALSGVNIIDNVTNLLRTIKLRTATCLEIKMRFSSNRRLVLAGLAASASLGLTQRLQAQTSLPAIAVSKDPNCGCCSGWVAHLRQAGFTVTTHDTQELPAIKARLGVPDGLASCHTAEVNGYVIEGHVPADAIKRLLGEAPRATGLAVPGMPTGSPGMEGGAPDTYEVVLFGSEGQSVFARYRGSAAL